jgi:hypothetical protein
MCRHILSRNRNCALGSHSEVNTVTAIGTDRKIEATRVARKSVYGLVCFSVKGGSVALEGLGS